MRVEAFSVKRTYSSSPSRRCAFSIGFVLLLYGSLCQLERPPVGVYQAKLVGPALTMVDDLGVTFLFDEGRDVFDRSPAGDMPVASLAENAIEEAGRAQQSHVAAVQRCDRPPCRPIVVRKEQWRHLLPGRRIRQHIFEEVIREASVGERGCVRPGHRIGLANTSLQLRHMLETSIKTNLMKLSLVLFERRAPNVVTDAQNCDLAVLDRFRIRHAKYIQRGEVRTENPCAVV